VGGAAGSSTTVYFLGSSNNRIYYESPLPTGTTEDPEEGGYVQTSLTTFDIAREGDANSGPGDIWVASDHADSPIRSYNMAGTLTCALDLVPIVRGMAFSSSGGHRYVWASNPLNSTIYQIDLDAGTGVGEATTEPVIPGTVTVSENPFVESVSIIGSGFGSDAVIEIFDVYGRRIRESGFPGSFAWNGSDDQGAAVSPGVYYIRVHDASGRETRLSVVRL
jgi:hypothetical protein